MPLAVLVGTSRAGQQGDHRGPRPHADDADVRLPPAGRAVLRHRRQRGRREHDDLRPPTARPDRRASGSGRCRRTTIEATDSAGQTYWQRLRKVQLPMARKTIIVGLNQTTLAALSMATLAAFVNGPGLGKPVLAGLRINDVGRRLRPGRADRGDGRHARPHDHGGQRAHPRRWPAAAAATSGSGASSSLRAAVGTIVARLCSRAPTSAWPSSRSTRLGDKVADVVNEVMDWVTDIFGGVTGAFKDLVTNWLLNPMQSLLAESPWYVSCIARSPPSRWCFGGSGRCVSDPRLPDRHLVLRPVARRDDHPDHDPGRHRPGDGPGPGLRRLDGARPQASTSASDRCSTQGRRSRRSST